MKIYNWVGHGLFLLIILLLHVVVPSYFNGKSITHLSQDLIDNSFFESVLEYRQTGEFYRRPFMYTWLNVFPSFHQFLFIITSLTALFITSIGTEKFVRIVAIGLKEYNSIWLVYLNYAILFSFTTVIMTFDDTIQYVLLLIWLILLFSNRFLFSIVFFVLACISRETSFILLPILFVKSLDLLLKERILYIMSSIVAYILFIYSYVPKNILLENFNFLIQNRPLAFIDNFGNGRTAINSLQAFIFTCGFAVISIYHYLRNKIKYLILDQSYIKVAIIIFIINTLLVFFGGRATEARLFFIGLIPLFPIMMITLNEIYSFLSSKEFNSKWTWQILLAFFIVLIPSILLPNTLQGKLFLSYKVLYSFTILFCVTILFYFPYKSKKGNQSINAV